MQQAKITHMAEERASTNLGRGIWPPQCPWEWLIVIKPDLTPVKQQIPRGARTGTITSTQLAAKGLHVFTDIGSITVGSTSS